MNHNYSTFARTLKQDQKKLHQREKINVKFSQKKVTFAETPLFFPEGYEQLFLALYFVTLPYIIGIIFLFFFIAKGKGSVLMALRDQNFFLVWAIGYEIIAGFIFIWIIKMALGFSKAKKTKPLRY
ncbi:MAG: hypothetical protein RL113_1304 [Pseudomonadota bacterium]